MFSHKNISHISLTCKSSWSNFLQQPASKSSFDHIQEVHVLVLSIRPRCKKNKSKFHFIYGKKTICCLDQHLKVDEIKDIYTSTILTEKNSSSEMQSDWKCSYLRTTYILYRRVKHQNQKPQVEMCSLTLIFFNEN